MLVFLLSVSIVSFCASRFPRWATLVIGIAAAWVAFEIRQDTLIGLLILVLTALLLVGQVIAPLILDFLKACSQIKYSTLFKIFGRTFLLGSPAIILASASIYFTYRVNDWIIEQTVYELPSEAAWSCTEDARLLLVCHESEEGLPVDIDRLVVRVFATVEAELKGNIRSAVSTGDSSTEEGVDQIADSLFGETPLIAESLPAWSSSFAYRTESCHWYHWIKITSECIQRIVLMPLDEAYRDLRRGAQEQFSAQSSAGLAAGDRTGEYLISSVDSFVDFHISVAREKVRSANSQLFWVSGLLNMLSLSFVILVCLKILLIIFARFVFDPQIGGIPITFGQRKVEQPSRIRVCDITRTVDIGSSQDIGFSQAIGRHDWYVNFSGSLRAHRRGQMCIPRPFAFLAPRLLSGKILFSKYDLSSHGGSFGGHGPHDLRFIRVSLPANKRVVVRIENLTAFSGGVRMRSIFDPTLALLLHHSFFLRVFEGPGHLILSASGGTARVMMPSSAAAEPFDIIAFDLDGGFQLDVNHGLISVYFDGYSLIPTTGTAAIRTTAPSIQRSAKHLFRKLLFFLMPT